MAIRAVSPPCLSRETRFHPCDRRPVSAVSHSGSRFPEKFESSGNGGATSPRIFPGWTRRDSPRKIRERKRERERRPQVHAADLSSTPGSKDDGTHGTVAAPSDSKPRTGRPTRLNTWEIAAASSAVAAADSSPPCSLTLCHPLSTRFHFPIYSR